MEPPAATPALLDPQVDAILAEMLQEAEDLLPFARAVVVHLSKAPGNSAPQMDVATQVLEALAWGVGDGEPDEVGGATFLLDQHPALLASFFQNADLLDPRSPRTAGIAKAVMIALERIGRSRDD